jgi:hypothetical protein
VETVRRKFGSGFSAKIRFFGASVCVCAPITAASLAGCSAPSQQSAEPAVGASFANAVPKSAKGDRLARIAPAAKPLGTSQCPPEMASVDGDFCVDRYEASLVEILPNLDELAWSPFQPVEGHTVRAVSRPSVFPQGYISAVQARDACKRSNKRLCKPAEWRKACMGPEKTTFGYGNARQEHRCNDYGRSPVMAMFGLPGRAHAMWGWEKLNNPFLNQLDGTLARTASHEQCTNAYGVYDMVGNLHEWVADPNGTFYGGYYQDTHLHGDGCTYTTVAHSAAYHDYSTGFRCCADISP